VLIRGWEEQPELGHDAALDEVLLDDALQVGGRARVVPDPIGVDYRDGSVFTDPQAVGFAAEDRALLPSRRAETEFSQASFEVIPGSQTRGAVAAFGFGWVGAEEDVAPEERRLLVQVGHLVIGQCAAMRARYPPAREVTWL